MDEKPESVQCLKCAGYAAAVLILSFLLYVVTTMPARAQLTFPVFPQPPRGGAICNEEHTLCVVNYADYATDQMLLGASKPLIEAQGQLIGSLRAELDKRTPPKCAIVEKVPMAPPPKPPVPKGRES